MKMRKNVNQGILLLSCICWAPTWAEENKNATNSLTTEFLFLWILYSISIMRLKCSVSIGTVICFYYNKDKGNRHKEVLHKINISNEQKTIFSIDPTNLPCAPQKKKLKPHQFCKVIYEKLRKLISFGSIDRCEESLLHSTYFTLLWSAANSFERNTQS